MALTQTEVSQLYVSVFGRASEGDGNSYWMTDPVSTDMTTTANVMLNTEAAIAYFGTTMDDNAAFVAHIYTNTLGKSYADDSTGQDYWTAELAAGKSKGEMIHALITAAQLTVNAGNAQDQFNNQVTVSNYAADNISTFTDIATFTAYISSVDETTASVTTAQAAVLADVPVVVGEAFTLTTTADLVTGTANDDTINGLVGTNPATGVLMDTMQSVDIIDGGAGTDTLNIQTAEGNGVGATINDVENIKFKAFAIDTMNMANVTGMTAFENSGSIANLTLDNIGNLIDLTVKDVNNQTTGVNYSASAVSTLTDTQNLTLNNVSNNAVIDMNSGNIETIAITTTGAASKVQLMDVDKITKLTVTGDQNLQTVFITTAVAALKTVDAATATGNLTLDLANATASKMAITTGTGDDKVTVANFTNDDSVDLGAGADTLVIETGAQTVSTATTMTGVETAQFVLAASASYNMAGATELTTIALGSDNFNIGLTKLVATVNTVNYNAGGVTGGDALSGLSFGLATASGTTDALTINFTNKDADGNLIDPGAGAQLTAGISASGVEDITITSDKLGANTTGTTAATADGGVAVTLTDIALQTLTLTGETLLDVQTAAMAAIKTVDASNATGGVILDLLIAEDSATTTGKSVTVTTGSGNDLVDNILGKVATTITTGAGNDIINDAGSAFAEKVTIDAGAGDDIINIATAAAAAVEKAITLGDGVDILTVVDSDGSIVVADFVAGNGGDKLDFIANNAAGTGVNPTVYTEATFAGAMTSGMNVETGATVSALTGAGVAAWSTASGAVLNNADNLFYLAISDGTDTGIFKIDDTNANVDIVAADAVLVVTLTGISDPSTLVADNFSDFL